MHNKIKLPLTAVFSFLLGSVVFFPWDKPQEITDVSTKVKNSDFIFDRTTSDSVSKKEAITNQQIVEIENNSVKAVDTSPAAAFVKYQFSKDELKDSNLTLKNLLKNNVYLDQNQLAQYKLNISQQVPLARLDIKPPPATIIVKYHFSNDELLASNLTIQNQLNKAGSILDERINPVIETLKKSGEAIPVVFDDIKREITKVITNVINDDSETETRKVIVVKKVNYQFPDKLLELSNQAIQKQLSRYVLMDSFDDEEIIIGNKLNISELEIPEISENEQYLNEVEENDAITELSLIDDNSAVDDGFQATRSFFDDASVESSNRTIQMQLRGYKGKDSQISENNYDQEIAISEDVIEVIEYSEDEMGEINYAEVEFDEDEQHEITKHKKVTFSESEIKLSNLAISKQLRRFKKSSNKAVSTKSLAVDSSDTKSLIASETAGQSDYEDESDLLISNSEHEGSEDDYSKITKIYNSLPKFRKYNLNSTAKKQLQESEINDLDDDDEDEYSGERVVFNEEPDYFTDSFEKEATNVIDKNFELPDVENIENNIVSETLTDISDISEIIEITEIEEIEEIEIIEEINISDDNSIVTSAVN